MLFATPLAADRKTVIYFDLLELIGQINAAWKKAGFQRFAVNQMNLVGTKGYKHPTSLQSPNQPRNKHTARVGSGIGALAVKKKAVT
ncbi:MAG: hypothetical protein DHS20C18_46930 [Saprospiraceae bacterium]|nr:MAG: hypothetical protein DHS20C18_46930 [Saprospiraceae bacterium]